MEAILVRLEKLEILRRKNQNAMAILLKKLGESECEERGGESVENYNDDE